MYESWEIIVVGAGSAGAAFATRCAEQGRRVLLLEAGMDYRAADLPDEWRSPNPLNGLLSPTMAEYMWSDLKATRTESQSPYLYWRGRGVGGSSTVNGQIAIRPPLEDFDDWSAGGCAGWSREDVLPYFCALEADQDFGAADYHGSDGPTPVYRAPVSAWGSVDEGLRSAALDHGFPWAEDVNAPGATGVSPYPINSRDFQRISTNDAYLEGGRELATLAIRGNSPVDTVVFEGTNAVGVRLAKDGTVLRADEIVLSAGLIGSPAILMRSGVGPSRVLRLLGIDVLVDLPVGEGMQDHPMIRVGLPLRPEHSAGPNDRHTNCCVRYDSGMAGVPNDMMLVGMNQNVLSMNAPDLRAGAGAIGVWVNRTFSEGSVQISSTDPSVQPIVRENMLSDKRDLARLREGTRRLVELLNHPSTQKICDGDLWRVNADLWTALRGTDSDLESYIMATALDTQHGTSTCRMGPADSARTVVDPRCRVLGTAHLSVIDASIFPFVPRANTNLTAIMTGEFMAARFFSA